MVPEQNLCSSAYKIAWMRSAYAGYVIGLVATLLVMNIFNAAQPALLYIVPAVLGAVAGHAYQRKEFKQVTFPCAALGLKAAHAMKASKFGFKPDCASILCFKQEDRLCNTCGSHLPAAMQVLAFSEARDIDTEKGPTTESNGAKGPLAEESETRKTQ